MNPPVGVEICVDSIASAVAAQGGGVHRVELCSSLSEGGTTPSVGLMEGVRRRIGIGLHVIIRPRAGDFCYDACDFESMKRDVLIAKQVGADGVVFGVLHEEGQINTTRARQLVELASPMSTTFHRAFDMSSDLNQALEDIIAIGMHRVLTSGGEQRAEDGVSAISHLITTAKDRVAIMVGGGIRETNARRILAATGAREIHANIGHTVPSPMRFRNNKISLGSIRGQEYQRVIVSQDQVRRLVEAATGALNLAPTTPR